MLLTPATPGRRFVAFAVLGVALLSERPAGAQRYRSVTLLGVSGPGGDAMSSQLELALGERFAMVDGGVYRIKAREMNKTGASPEEVSAVCRRLRIDAMVAGSIRPGDGGKPALRLVVRDGATGEVLGKTDEGLTKGGVLTDRARRRLLERTGALIDHALGVHRPKPMAEAEEEDDDDEDNASVEEEIEPAPERRVTVRKAPARKAPVEIAPKDSISLDGGFAILTRNLDFDGGALAAYRGGAVAALRFDAALHPFAWTPVLAAAHPFLAALGLDASLVTTLPFISNAPSGETIPTHARRFDVALSGRIPLDAAHLWMLRLSTGYGEINYASDDAGRLSVPDVNYKFVRQAAGLIIPLYRQTVQLDAGAALMAVADTGPIGAVTEFGDGRAWGLDLDAALTVRPLNWLFLRVGARYSRMTLDFHGAGARIGSGAHDQLFDAGIMVGYAAR